MNPVFFDKQDHHKHYSIHLDPFANRTIPILYFHKNKCLSSMVELIPIFESFFINQLADENLIQTNIK